MRILHDRLSVSADWVDAQYAKKIGGLAAELLYSDNVGSIRQVSVPEHVVGYVYYVPSSRSWSAVHADGTLMSVGGDFFCTTTMRHSARLLVDDYLARKGEAC